MADLDLDDYLKATLVRYIQETDVDVALRPERAQRKLDHIEGQIRRRRCLDKMEALSERMRECDTETMDGMQRWLELQEEWDRWNDKYNEAQQ